jgi:hypothetical protein
VWRRFCFKPFKIGEPDLDEPSDPLLDAGGPRELECLLVTLAHFRGLHALFQPVIPGKDCLVYSV